MLYLMLVDIDVGIEVKMKFPSCIFLVISFKLISPIEVISDFNSTIDIGSKLPSNNKLKICTNVSNSTESKKFCFDAVKRQSWPKNESSIHPKLLCAEKDSAIITWTNDTAYDELAIQISSSANQSNAIYSVLGRDQKHYDFFKLKPITEYHVLILRRSFPFEEIFQNDVSELNFTTTTDETNETLLNNLWFNVTNLSPVNDTYINATIRWNSLSEVLPCRYEVKWVLKKDLVNIQTINCFKSELMECIIPFLRYRSTYRIWTDFSSKIVLNYNTPSCNQFAIGYKNLICSTIPQVEGISANNNDFINDSKYSVTISWNFLDFQPDYYNVTIEIRASNETRTFYNAKTVENGNNLTVSLPCDRVYRVNVTAHMGNISSEPSSEEFFTPHSLRRNFSDGRNEFIFRCIFLFVALVVLVILIFTYWKFKRYDDSQELKKQKQYNGIVIKNMETILSNIEIKKKFNEPQKLRLVLGKMLGRGNFGIVFQGSLMTNGKKVMDVAVKTVRDNATTKDIHQFKKEISLMEDVGFHNNIVSMIGSCFNSKRPLLIVEYCPFGDLHAYLCDIKKTQINFPDYNPTLETQYQNLVPIESYENSKYLVHNKIYGVTKDVVVPELSICDLLSFGRQVAIGMEYLASNYVIHRDLAARNILLCNDKTVKISDFGLSRDIYAENIYRKLEGGEVMPIKWMALESICNREYSTLSDVWSFGIFLWELFTMGDEPYPDITVPEVLVLQLRKGYRMQNPCPSYPELYGIMLNCWQEQPELRPQFSTLRDLLDQILKQCSPNQYITITGNED